MRRNKKSSVCFGVDVGMRLARSAVMEPPDQITILSTISLIPLNVSSAKCNNAVAYV